MGTTSAFQFSCGLAQVVAVLVIFLCVSGPGYVEGLTCGDLVARVEPSQVEPNFDHSVVGFKVSLSEQVTIKNITVSFSSSAGTPPPFLLLHPVQRCAIPTLCCAVLCVVPCRVCAQSFPAK
jgi:hypothetical protein